MLLLTHFQSSPHMFTIFHVHSTSFEHLEGARRLVWLRDYIEEAAQKLTRDRGRTFPQPQKASKDVSAYFWMLSVYGCLGNAAAAAAAVLMKNNKIEVST